MYMLLGEAYSHVSMDFRSSEREKFKAALHKCMRLIHVPGYLSRGCMSA